MGDLNADTGYPAPRLNSRSWNRLVVWAAGEKMGAILNGRVLGTANIGRDASTQAFLFANSMSGAEARLGIASMQVFAATS